MTISEINTKWRALLENPPTTISKWEDRAVTIAWAKRLVYLAEQVPDEVQAQIRAAEEESAWHLKETEAELIRDLWPNDLLSKVRKG